MVPFAVTNIFKSFKTSTRPIPPVPEKVWQDPLYFLAFGLGSGAMPFAPGTFGTLMAIPFYLLFASLSPTNYLTFVAIFIVISSLICEKVSRAIKVHDHPGMCIDEFAGFFVTMINAPPGIIWIILGFFLFRLFDIWKPWPISFFDKHLHGGFGMIFDDVLSGIYAFVIIQCVYDFVK